MYPESLYPDPDIQKDVKKYDKEIELQTNKEEDRCYPEPIQDGNEPSQVDIKPSFSGHTWIE
jgi:hypothetical protein